MSFKEVQTLDAENATPIGGVNRKTGKKNPTSAEGYFLGTRMVESKKAKTGQASLHYIQTPKGNLGIWGKTDLDRKLSAVTPGTMVRITFDKMQATPNGEMYKYKVEVDSSNTIEVATGGPASFTSADAGEGEYEETNYGGNEDESGSEDDEDTAQAAELAAIERKNKVQALLNKGKNRS